MRRIARAALSVPSAARSFTSVAGEAGSSTGTYAGSQPPQESSMTKRLRKRYRKRPRPVSDVLETRSHYASTMSMIDGVREARRRKPVPRDPKDEAARLKQMLATAGGRAPSLDKMEYQEAAKEKPSFPEDTELSEEHIPLGSFVELRGGTTVQHAITLRYAIVDSKAGFKAITSSGEIWDISADFAMFHIPRVLPLDLITRCGVEDTAQNEHELAARTKALHQLREMERTIEERRASIMRSHEAMYEQFRHPDPEQWSTVTPLDVARTIRRKGRPLGPIDVLVAHKFLFEDNLHFVRQYDFMSESSFDVRPKAHVELLSTVLQWARPGPGEPDNRHILEGFASKAAEVIRRQRELSAATRDEPLARAPAEHHWTPKERVVLRTLCNAIDVTRENTAYDGVMWYVVGRMLPHEAQVNADTVSDAMRELGVLSPMLNPALLASTLRLPINKEEREAGDREDNAVIESAAQRAVAQQTPLGPEDFHIADPLEAVRHDWGDTPVYVVDDVDAHELDDGISVERDGEDTWVHVHVADPASLLPPGHTFVQRAAVRTETLYLHDRVYPLLPTSLVQHPTLGSSLAGNRGRPDRVLTFSSKVDAEGRLQDFTVRAGLARNVKKFSYDAVDAALGIPRSLPAFPFGMPSIIRPVVPANLDAADLENLKTLHNVAKLCIRQRCDDGIFVNKEYKASPWHIDGNLDKDIYFEPGAFRGAPRIELAVRNVKQETSGSRGIIAEAMKLAGRAASLYGLHNDLPLIRRSASAPVPRTDTDLETLLAMRDEEGFVEWHDVISRLELPSTGAFTLQPSAHFTLGVPEGEGYVRVTSPLRRYADLLAHYNIHHRLAGAAGPLPFDARALDEHMHRLRRRTRFKRRMEASENQYWSTMFVQRYVEDMQLGKADGRVLRNLDAYVHLNYGMDARKMEFRVDTYVPKLGMRLRAYKDDQALAALPIGARVRLDVTGGHLGIPSHLHGQVTEI